MPMPVRHLPVLQNWDCHVCGECCKRYEVELSDDEHQRIAEQGWHSRPEFADTPPTVRVRFGSQKYRLNRRVDGSCVFLNEQGQCRIHSEFGSTAKPLACQIYPYVLIPAGDHWRIGVRYSCPSATANMGRPVTGQAEEIAPLLRQVEVRESISQRSKLPARLGRRQFVVWDDLARIVAVLSTILADASGHLEHRWRWVLAVVNICRQSQFGDVTGTRLTEFLDLLAASVVDDLAQPELPPTSLGRTLFRLTTAAYCRAATTESAPPSIRQRLAMVRAAWRFTLSRGDVPQMNRLIVQATFARAEEPFGDLPAESNELLTRYYRTKLESYQFFGPTCHDLSFWDGLDGLALTLPVILWLARTQSDRSIAAAIESALQIVDDNFGYNAQLGSRRFRWMSRQLSRRGDLSRLIAWYAR